MSEKREKREKSIQGQIGEYLSDAILRSGQATAIVMAISMKDGKIFTRGVVPHVLILGLAEAVHIEARVNWLSDPIEDGEESQ